MEINFTSRIVPLKGSDFSKLTAGINRDNFVDFPWLLSSSKVAKDVFTTNVADCSACLVTDGQKALLLHLIPTNDNNHRADKILSLIERNFDLKSKYLQGLLTGSQNTKKSLALFDTLKTLLSRLNIPATILKTGKNRTHLAYKTSTDEIYISNLNISKALDKGINNSDAIKSGFKTVEISKSDEI